MKIPVALQLYSVRDDAARDLTGTLAALAEIGYAGVEFAGYHGHSAADIRRMLDNSGLKSAGSHVGITTLLGDELKHTVEFNLTIGNKFLIVPGLPPEYQENLDSWRRTAGLFNEIATELKQYGMATGYHNHSHEFIAVDGVTPWDVFCNATLAEVVLQFDCGNALAGGVDVVPMIRHYRGRARTVHLKEYSANNPKALIGEGDVAWPQLLKACEEASGAEWYIIEQESYPLTPLESVARCYSNLQQISG